MKGDRLGEFEELALLSVYLLGDEAYAVAVQESIESRAGRDVSMGAVYSVLDRLERKGYLESSLGAPSGGGRERRFVAITGSGIAAVEASRDVRESYWRSIAGRGATS